MEMMGSLADRSNLFKLLFLFFIAFVGLIFFMTLGVLFSAAFMSLDLSGLMDSGLAISTSMGTDVFLFLQGMATIGTFLIPALVGAYLYNARPLNFLGINSLRGNWWLAIILVLIITVSGTSLSDALFRFSHNLSFPAFLADFKAGLDEMDSLMQTEMSKLLQMSSFMDFFKVFTVLAILPAICEEALFRGVLQPIFKKRFGSIWAIWITAFLFAMMHQQFYSFLSIFALGAVLGYLREWSGGLWLSILMHLLNNGMIVLGVYFFDLSYLDLSTLSDDWSLWYSIPLFAVFLISLFVLQRHLERYK